MNILKTQRIYKRKTPTSLPLLFRASGESNQNGVAITAYGEGQVTGGMFTVPAHGEITVNFALKLLCVTPQDVQNLSALIRSLLDASHQHLYDDIQHTDISGGAGFFGFFSAGVSASFSETKHTMDSWGLSERNQEAIIDAMMKVVQVTSDFNYQGTIYNRDYDYDVTGSLFGIVMDATIAQGAAQNQLRFLAPEVHMSSSDGKRLPLIGKLYDMN